MFLDADGDPVLWSLALPLELKSIGTHQRSNQLPSTLIMLIQFLRPRDGPFSYELRSEVELVHNISDSVIYMDDQCGCLIHIPTAALRPPSSRKLPQPPPQSIYLSPSPPLAH